MDNNKRNLELACLMTSILTDESHLKNHKICVDSIRNQSELPDIFLASSYLYRGGVKELYDGKLQQEKDYLKPINSDYLPHFKQLEKLVQQQLSNKDPNYCWVFFSGDDGIWNKDRTKHFKDAVKNVQTNENIDCIIIANETKHFNQKRLLQCAEHVDLAIQEKQLKITQWLPDDEGRKVFEMHEICVRLKVLLDFFKEKPEDLLWNFCCDIEFTTYATEYKSIFHLVHPTSWSYMWRLPDKYYQDMSGLQWTSINHGIGNAFHFVPMLIKIGEMFCCPTMQHTANTMLTDILNKVPDELEKRMLIKEFKDAVLQKSWIKKKIN
jgi:hypothetical protein